jgi:hypothetical protein
MKQDGGAKMKTRTWTKIGLAAGLWLAGSGAGWAQRNCLPFTDIWPPADSPYVTCTVTMEFVRPVDLDGDGVADFTHERFLAQSRFNAVDDSGEFYHQDDTVEALFPAGHVEVYWLIWGPTFGDPVPRLSAGQELVMEPEVVRPGPDGRVPRRYGSWGLPEPARSYVYPYYFEPWGLGVIYRHARYTCELNGIPRTCGNYSFVGYLGELWDIGKGEQEVEGYFGFRLRREDGWHLGWLRLRWRYVPRFGAELQQNPYPDPVELVDWAVHPEAEAGIVVGEPPRPRLMCAREGEELVMRWSPVWTNAVLERAGAPAGAAWEPVAGVTNATVRVPAQGPSAFYRLRVW